MHAIMRRMPIYVTEKSEQNPSMPKLNYAYFETKFVHAWLLPCHCPQQGNMAGAKSTQPGRQCPSMRSPAGLRVRLRWAHKNTEDMRISKTEIHKL